MLYELAMLLEAGMFLKREMRRIAINYLAKFV